MRKPDVVVSVPSKIFTDTVNVLRKIIEDHTGKVERPKGTYYTPGHEQTHEQTHERCTVCDSKIKQYSSEHRMSDHCTFVEGKFCWVGDLVGVLDQLLS